MYSSHPRFFFYMSLCCSLLTTVSQPSFPNLSWEPLKEVAVVDRGQFADPAKANLLGSASKVKHLTPSIGTEILGIDLRQLTDAQKDEL